MPLSSALIVIVALVATAVAAGLVWRARDGRRRDAHGERVDAADAGVLGARATLVQFSTEMCARCPQVRRMLGGVADGLDGVEHVDIDLTHRTDLATKYRVLQTPTLLVVDGDGTVRARFNGVPHRSDIENALGDLSMLQEA
ncbi:thioredoxin family protein [Microbacterium esteraromaticum]|uniref:Thioredoxin family protein n=1 Tax=Microbacterium esteraromaticum TaxID=57043 RepID=A0A939IVP4_9MICO|nr:thioredoxin family protein [Microbacterium esteraromaticum]MBN8416038.1 thioredoxin family protein [Microbacterium esteraromaticum]MBN8423624.1 thioredoxin family protein [Microbacterium esteraromaticum]